MKKKISLLFAIVLCMAMAVNVFAETTTYDTKLTIAEDGTVTAGGSDVVTVDLDEYALVAEGTYQSQNGLVLTKPGFAIAYVEYRNEDQTPGEKIPMPFCVNYEVKLTQQRYEEVEGVLTKVNEFADNNGLWLDSGKPDFVKPGGGDFEWAYLEVTQDMIDAAGGSFEIVLCVRAPMYPDTPVEQLGQVMRSSYVHVYQEKAVVIGDKDVVGSFVAGNTEHIPVYQVDIAWGSFEFTYHQGNVGVWDAGTHTYVGGTASGWSCEEGADTITFTNNSNVDVIVNLEYVAKEGYEAIGGSFTDQAGDRINDLLLFSADNHEGENGAGKATVSICHLILSGELAATDTPVVLGNVLVTLD